MANHQQLHFRPSTKHGHHPRSGSPLRFFGKLSDSTSDLERLQELMLPPQAQAFSRRFVSDELDLPQGVRKEYRATMMPPHKLLVMYLMPVQALHLVAWMGHFLLT